MTEEMLVRELVRMLGSMHTDSLCRVDYAPSFTDDDGAFRRRATPLVTVKFFAHRYRHGDVGEKTFHKNRKPRKKRK